MTLYDLVERERRHVRGREVIAGALLVGGAAALIIALGAGLLGGARWLSLPRVLPFVVWGFVLAAAMGFSETGLEGGTLLVAAWLSVWLLNLLYRVGVKGDRERDEEDRARAYFDEHGRWPDEDRGPDTR